MTFMVSLHWLALHATAFTLTSAGSQALWSQRPASHSHLDTGLKRGLSEFNLHATPPSESRLLGDRAWHSAQGPAVSSSCSLPRLRLPLDAEADPPLQWSLETFLQGTGPKHHLSPFLNKEERNEQRLKFRLAHVFSHWCVSEHPMKEVIFSAQ